MVFNKISPSHDQEISPMTFLFRIMPIFLGDYYIGLNDLDHQGTFKWADGTATSFTNWKTGHPIGCLLYTSDAADE